MLSTLVKKTLYSVYPKSSLTEYTLNLGYIFHTEWIYHQKTFEGLLEFCKNYNTLTGARAICTIMTGANPLVVFGMKKENCSTGVFEARVHQLSECATLGYHGHFWNDVSKFQQAEYAIHTTTFEAEKFLPQFENDLEWFEKNSISHNGIYAGGWWFMNKFLIQKLLENNFNTDYSFSKAPYFYNAFSMNVMLAHAIKTGESFSLRTTHSARSLLCIQNLIGAHNTSFPLDFDRNLVKILDNKQVTGVINAHDYDRSFTTTLRCIEHLLKNSKARFHSHIGLQKFIAENSSREILI